MAKFDAGKVEVKIKIKVEVSLMDAIKLRIIGRYIKELDMLGKFIEKYSKKSKK